MISHKTLSVIFVFGMLMLSNGQVFAQTSQDTPVSVQNSDKPTRLQSDFNTLSGLEEACSNRKMTPEQYKVSCTNIVNALHQDRIISDEEHANLLVIVQNSTAKCDAIQNYYHQTDEANAAFLNGQISAETLKLKHDAELRILLDANYITPEIQAQTLAELDAMIAQHQQKPATKPQASQTPSDASQPQTPVFQTTVLPQGEDANPLKLFLYYDELYHQILHDYYQNAINDDEFRARSAELFDKMMHTGMLGQQERSKYEARHEKLIHLKNDLIALWNHKPDDMTPQQWEAQMNAMLDEAEREQLSSPQSIAEMRQKTKDTRNYLEQYDQVKTDYFEDRISDDEYRNKGMAIFDGLVGTGYFVETSREKNRDIIENHIRIHNHWLNKEFQDLNDRVESGRMPIRRFESESYALIDKAESEGFPSDAAAIYREEVNSAVHEYQTVYEGFNRRPDSFMIKLGANGGAAYYSYYHVNNDNNHDDSGEYWKGFAGGRIELGYMWNFYNISIGLFARQDLNYIFDSKGKSFLGMTNGIFRIAGVYYDSTLMISLDMGVGAAYNGDDSSFTMPFALGLDYYVSDRVGIGFGMNATWIMGLNDLNCIIQPDLHIIIDI